MPRFQDLLLDRQHARLLRLSFPHDDAPTGARLLVNRLDATESLSRDFHYIVELLSDDARIDADALQGRLLCISLVRADGSLRPFTGYVSTFRRIRTDGGIAFYEAVLVPWFGFLRLRHNSRLFHDRTLEEQARTIFGDYDALPRWAWHVSDAQPRFTMATQWSETDHNYLSRRLEAAGWSYRHEHTADGHTLVVESDTLGAPAIDGATPEVRFHKGGPKDEDAIAEWNAVRHWAPGRYAVSGFDFKAPHPVSSEAPTLDRQGAVPALEVHRYEGHHGFRPELDAYTLAKLRMKEIEARGLRYEAQGNCARMAPGRWFRLTDHFAHAGQDAEFLILEVRHHASNNYLQDTDAPAVYRNSVVCQPRATPWHPGVGFDSTPTRLLEVQTATVTGPKGQGSLHVDEYGRIRVRFHWDRDEAASSAWVRVASPWAGGEQGMVSLPRVGSEVVVQWLDGNPDHPIVTGSVANRDRMPPWQLPGQQALTGLRSRELTPTGGNAPGGRSNHLVLDDTAGAIQAQLRSDHQASQLSLGHVTRIDDTAGRKDARGQGFELRTDGHGAVRAGKGLLISTEARPGAEAHLTDMAETVARLKDGHALHQHLADVAQQAGAQQGGDQDTVADALQAQATALEGQGGAPEQGRFPEFRAPHLTLASPAGIEATTHGSTHLASAAHTALTSGGHTSIGAGRSLLVSVKEAVRLFAFKAGMKLVAAGADIDITALKNSINLLAKLDITHTAGRITLTAKDEVVINGGGSFSRWSAGGIEHGTPGTWRQQAAAHNLSGPANAPVPKLLDPPTLEDLKLKSRLAFVLRSHPVGGRVFAHEPYALLKDGAKVKDGMTDGHGQVLIDDHELGAVARYEVQLSNGHVFELPVKATLGTEDDRLAAQGFRAARGEAEDRLRHWEHFEDA